MNCICLAKYILKLLKKLKKNLKENKWNIIDSDKDDNKYIDCYIKSSADYLVTNDKHFNILKEIRFPNVNCISIEEFMEILKKLQ